MANFCDDTFNRIENASLFLNGLIAEKSYGTESFVTPGYGHKLFRNKGGLFFGE